ncbi:MAG: UDP-N-acetylmuramate dehydrogenase [Gammaproteobacteria bacterium]|nr:UDP-N-acetylmuramate dehydrogenase [Gammaproteobacteria bacterium]
MNDLVEAAELAIRGRLLKNSTLADYTSWRTGGTAEYIYIPADLEDLSIFLKSLPKTIPLTWLGLGSNTLVRDAGVDGVVIITQGGLDKITQVQTNQIRAEAGVSSAKLARSAARLSTTGLEFMAGIPGTVGGALAMNAGCFGGETWQFVEAVEMIDRSGNIRTRKLSDFTVNYRHVLKPVDEWFVAGHFTLQPGVKEKSLEAIRTLLEKRNHSQPTGTANCGSVFRNPPHDFAGRLIETCGLKTLRIGGASVSSKHANFIINESHATAADIENLINQVGSIVYQKTGVRLIPEVCIIGKAVGINEATKTSKE